MSLEFDRHPRPEPAWPELRGKARARLLRMHYEARAGHLGSGLSCLEILLTLYHQVMAPGDRFILSKGHAAGAWYVVLWTRGLLTDDDLRSFCRDGGLPAHPSGSKIPDLLFSTGSLGHGPSLAAGLALAARRAGSARRVYCLCSDGEWQEGAVWEALIFAVRHQLNLTYIIDQNGWQAFGRTSAVAGAGDLAPRLAAFGLPVVTGPGHDLPELKAVFDRSAGPGPRGLVLTTVKGHSLPFFEDRLESHYLPLTAEQYESLQRPAADRPAP